MSDSRAQRGLYQPDQPEADFAYWAKMPAWEWWEGAAILNGINPKLARHSSDVRAKVSRDAFLQFSGVQDLVSRALDHGQLRFPENSPSHWLNWARIKDIPIITALEIQVAKFHPNKETEAPKTARVSELEATVARLTADLSKAKATAEQSLPIRERESMLKIIVGMAIAGYRYNPNAKRNDSIGDITKDIVKVGVTLSDDTVRKYLAEAAELVPPQEKP